MKMPWTKPETGNSTVTTKVAPIAPPIDPTAPKGKPTPRQRDAQPRRSGPVAPPPKTAKEARVRMREQSKTQRADVKAGRVAKAEPQLTRRDIGPERALIRNMVDSRRSIASFFPIFAVLLLVLYFTGMQQRNVQVYNVFTWIWLAVFIIIIGESIFLGRKIRRRVKTEFPATTQKMGGLIWYGVIRSLMFRRGRFPKPVVNVGDTV